MLTFYDNEYWWFPYDVIKNMTMLVMINLPQFLLKPMRPYNITCLCTKFELIWTNENRVMGQKSWEILYYVAAAI